MTDSLTINRVIFVQKHMLSHQTLRVDPEIDGNVCQWHEHNRNAAQQNASGESKAQ